MKELVVSMYGITFMLNIFDIRNFWWSDSQIGRIGYVKNQVNSLNVNILSKNILIIVSNLNFTTSRHRSYNLWIFQNFSEFFAY